MCVVSYVVQYKSDIDLETRNLSLFPQWNRAIALPWNWNIDELGVYVRSRIWMLWNILIQFTKWSRKIFACFGAFESCFFSRNDLKWCFCQVTTFLTHLEGTAIFRQNLESKFCRISAQNQLQSIRFWFGMWKNHLSDCFSHSGFCLKEKKLIRVGNFLRALIHISYT